MTHPQRVPNRLDSRDLKILEIIQTQGRISMKALADAIDLSLSPCSQRVRRLEREGYIGCYRGILDARRLGSCVWIYTEVSLARHRAADLMRFEAAVRKLPEVLECDAVGGGIDYVLKLVARDVAHYQRVIEDLLARGLGIDTYFTYVVTKRVKDSPVLPLSTLLAR